MSLNSTFSKDRCPFDVAEPADVTRWAESLAAADKALGDHDRYGLLPRYEWPGPA